ncbi:dienelactone hydrolase family protein [Actinomadura sp. 9N407]|uniref:dienelactone hydrolase family protein n=1 Tax=Actinomadura sp. 9N407 TaxID=3375154 RepID=UPI0037B96F42
MPTETLRIPTPDGPADAFAAFPDRAERHPGVLLYTDAFGVRPVLEEMARELAEHGYYVLVPNFFHRHGPAPVIELPEHIGEEARPEVIARLMPLLQEHLTEERVLGDADAYLRFLSAQPQVTAGPVALVGYCIGAALAMRIAAAHPERVAAVAGFHPGFVVTDGPDSLHRLIPELTAQVHLGLSDDLPPEAISELDQALDAAGVGHTTEVYPGTVHGFTMADTDAFDSSALQRHWDRLLPLLDRTLANGRGSG